jgi:hypothetical protein
MFLSLMSSRGLELTGICILYSDSVRRSFNFFCGVFFGKIEMTYFIFIYF